MCSWWSGSVDEESILSARLKEMGVDVQLIPIELSEWEGQFQAGKINDALDIFDRNVVKSKGGDRCQN